MANDLIRSRLASFMGYSHEGNRDLYAAFGYSRAVTVEELYSLYTRNEIAHRIIRAFSQSTWREMPHVGDSRGHAIEKGDNFSPFALEFDDLSRRMSLQSVFERADRLSSIGRYGLVVMGFADGKSMSEPLSGKAKLAYLSTYGELGVSVSKYDTDTRSSRYGLPEIYAVKQAATSDSGPTSPKRMLSVHHSRVIHLAEVLDEDDVLGMPRLLPLVNRLNDLEKVMGGGSEMYWLNGTARLGLWADKDANLSDDEVTAMKDQADEFQHQLRRVLIGQGITAQMLQSPNYDPGPIVDKLLELIAGSVGLPKRILVGTERGELSSAQDENNWSERIAERRVNFAAPRILMPFLIKMIDTGNLSAPEGAAYAEWDKSTKVGPIEESTIASNLSTALATYANAPDAQMLVPPAEFRSTFLKLPPESEFKLPDEPTALPEDTRPEDPAIKQAWKNAGARTLYVRRDVVNVADIKRWAKQQGFEDVVDDLHVTVVYSKSPVDWMKAGEMPYYTKDGMMEIVPGGPRVVEALGNEGAQVLHIASMELSARHHWIVHSCGATHDFVDYQPHITISYTPHPDLRVVEPYRGKIVLGPEIFEEIKRPFVNYDDDQARADDGKWTDGGGGGGAPSDGGGGGGGGSSGGGGDSSGGSGVEKPKKVKAETTRKFTKADYGVQKDGSIISKKKTPDNPWHGNFNPPPAEGTPAPTLWRTTTKEEIIPEGEGPGTKKELSGKSVRRKHYELAKESLASPLNREEFKNFRWYNTTNGHSAINGYLRTGTPDAEWASDANRAIERMDKAFGRTSLAREVSGDRYVSPHHYALLEAAVGGSVHEKGFTSVTANPNHYLKGEVGVGTRKRVRVVMPKGSKALPIADVAHLPEEAEILIARGSRFSVSKDKKGVLTLTLHV